ncbi:ubiquitin-protein transferase activating protein, partial [Ascosphaera acerosa]
MATATITSPLKTHHGMFSSKTVGGRLPLTPSPHAAKAANMAAKPAEADSPATTATTREDKKEAGADADKELSSSKASSSVYSNGNLAAKFRAARSARSSVTSTPRSSATRTAAHSNTPKHLEMGVSDFTLSGTGPGCRTTAAASATATKSSRAGIKTTTAATGTSATTATATSSKDAAKAKPYHPRLHQNRPDRFIPDRATSEGLTTAGAAKPDEGKAASDGSKVLANAASVYDIGGRAADEDLTSALQELGLADDDDDA